MDSVVHFEMPYEDENRLSKFYAETFGWQMRPLGAAMGNYVTAATAETDSNNMIKTPGAINGGFYPKAPGMPAQPSIVIAVDNLKDSMAKVTTGGGALQGEPMTIPGIGDYIAFIDTEGNRVGLLQPVNPM